MIPNDVFFAHTRFHGTEFFLCPMSVEVYIVLHCWLRFPIAIYLCAVFGRFVWLFVCLIILFRSFWICVFCSNSCLLQGSLIQCGLKISSMKMYTRNVRKWIAYGRDIHWVCFSSCDALYFSFNCFFLASILMYLFVINFRLIEDRCDCQGLPCTHTTTTTPYLSISNVAYLSTEEKLKFQLKCGKNMKI